MTSVNTGAVLYQLSGFIRNQHNNQLLFGLLAWLVEHCTGIRRGLGFKSRSGLNFFFRPYFHYCSRSVCYCEGRFHIHVFIRSLHIWFSYIHSQCENIYHWLLMIVNSSVTLYLAHTKKLVNDFRYMKLCYIRLTTGLVFYLARTEKVHAKYYSAQTEMLKIFSSINILSTKNYYHSCTWLDMGIFYSTLLKNLLQL